jgi:hypothetical protein
MGGPLVRPTRSSATGFDWQQSTALIASIFSKCCRIHGILGAILTTRQQAEFWEMICQEYEVVSINLK